MRNTKLLLSIVVSIVVAGCASRVDVAAETNALLEADRAWAKLASAGTNADSILAYWSDDANVAMPGQPIVAGKAALREMVKSSFGDPAFHIDWTPEKAVVSGSGDLGYTVGTNAVTFADSTGKSTTMNGRYLTVWRKDASGKWVCVEDYSSPAPPPAV